MILPREPYFGVSASALTLALITRGHVDRGSVEAGGVRSRRATLARRVALIETAAMTLVEAVLAWPRQQLKYLYSSNGGTA